MQPEQFQPSEKRAALALWMLAGLLVVLVALQSFALYQSIQSQKAQALRAEACTAAADDLLAQMYETLESYDETVYDNPQVDTIQKQTFMSLEHMLVLQNQIGVFMALCY